MVRELAKSGLVPAKSSNQDAVASVSTVLFVGRMRSFCVYESTMRFAWAEVSKTASLHLPHLVLPVARVKGDACQMYVLSMWLERRVQPVEVPVLCRLKDVLVTCGRNPWTAIRQST